MISALESMAVSIVFTFSAEGYKDMNQNIIFNKIFHAEDRVSPFERTNNPVRIHLNGAQAVTSLEAVRSALNWANQLTAQELWKRNRAVLNSISGLSQYTIAYYVGDDPLVWEDTSIPFPWQDILWVEPLALYERDRIISEMIGDK